MRAEPVLGFFSVGMIAVLAGPVLAGLIGVLLPAFGHFPQAGLTGPTFQPFRDLFDWPGIGPSIRLSVTTGLIATLASLILSLVIVATTQGTRGFAAVQAMLAPLLSVPHAAAAFSLAFLIAPSGFVARALSPWATGWDRPPDVLIVGDPQGFALVAGLVIKEVPFLLLMILAALPQVRPSQTLLSAAALGYGRVSAWFFCVFPNIYRQIRLPIYAVLAFSMSVVDVALILGPTTPSSLSVNIVRWMSDPDISLRTRAAAGAVVQLGLVLSVVAAWWLAERLCAVIGRQVGPSGRRHGWAERIWPIGAFAGMALVVTGVTGAGVLGLWSVAGFWGFPDVLPDGVSLRGWRRHASDLGKALSDTVVIAFLATAAALVLVVSALQSDRPKSARWLVYLPLIIPQTVFLPGLQTLLIGANADRGIGPVIAAHLIFVLPYVYLTLVDPWRAWDSRYASVGAALGRSPMAVLFTLRLPMLLRPVLTAVAVGTAVSVGQYLPTLLIGGGRVSTLTTEALALASGGDRQAIAVFAIMQTLAALAPFAIALGLPALVWRNRRGLSNG